MSILLLDLRANRLMNHTIFLHRLRIYDSSMVYEHRKLLRREETTISYSHVSQVNLINEIFFSHLEIINTGGVENIWLRFIHKKEAKRAKKLIDEKINRTHGVGYLAQSKPEAIHHSSETTKSENAEKTLTRLEFLLNQGRISKKEYNKQRSQLMRS